MGKKNIQLKNKRGDLLYPIPAKKIKNVIYGWTDAGKNYYKVKDLKAGGIYKITYSFCFNNGTPQYVSLFYSIFALPVGYNHNISEIVVRIKEYSLINNGSYDGEAFAIPLVFEGAVQERNINVFNSEKYIYIQIINTGTTSNVKIEVEEIF